MRSRMLVPTLLVLSVLFTPHAASAQVLDAFWCFDPALCFRPDSWTVDVTERGDGSGADWTVAFSGVLASSGFDAGTYDFVWGAYFTHGIGNGYIGQGVLTRVDIASSGEVAVAGSRSGFASSSVYPGFSWDSDAFAMSLYEPGFNLRGVCASGTAIEASGGSISAPECLPRVAVPEPGTMALLGTGLFGLLGVGLQRRKSD